MNEFKGPLDPFTALPARDSLYKGAVCDIAGYRQVGKEVYLLEDVADISFPGGQSANLAPCKENSALVKRQKTGGSAQEARLAAAGRTGQDEGLPACNRDTRAKGEIRPGQAYSVKFEGQGGPPWAGIGRS